MILLEAQTGVLGWHGLSPILSTERRGYQCSRSIGDQYMGGGRQRRGGTEWGEGRIRPIR